MAEKKLNDKQIAFVEAYLQTWNATKAAKMAGYSEKTAGSIGSENLQKPEIASRVRARLSEKAMKSDEVLARLAEHARSDIGELVDPATMTLDLKKALNEGNTRLVKKIKQTTITGDEKQTEIFEFEMYDAQAALVHIGKHLGLFTEKSEVEVEVTITDAKQRLQHLLTRQVIPETTEGDPKPTDG